MERLARLHVDKQGGIAVASIEGEIDLSNATQLELAISDAIPNQAVGLVVDLGSVRYLDSSGLGLLFNLARRVSRRQQAFAVVVPRQAEIREILGLGGATKAMVLHDEVTDAVLQLEANPGSEESQPEGD